ncbi:hypothetical protein AB0G85_24820 [Streptomyces sioyaensis]|uniref:hypothetical protein n=1 Tax=Streptomyces sioyaensis TaxID=67364 RepID=UPI0033CDE042
MADLPDGFALRARAYPLAVKNVYCGRYRFMPVRAWAAGVAYMDSASNGDEYLMSRREKLRVRGHRFRARGRSAGKPLCGVV